MHSTEDQLVARDPAQQGKVNWLAVYVESQTDDVCRHGHRDCALYEGGPCSNEALAVLHGLVDDEGKDLLDEPS